jgi:hypothetical protein
VAGAGKSSAGRLENGPNRVQAAVRGLVSMVADAGGSVQACLLQCGGGAIDAQHRQQPDAVGRRGGSVDRADFWYAHPTSPVGQYRSHLSSAASWPSFSSTPKSYTALSQL